MTLGITVKLNDGALLVVDGRRTFPLANRPPDDNRVKIFRITPQIAAIAVGVVQATDEIALPDLRASMKGAASPHQIQQYVITSVRAGWNNMLGRLLGVDPFHEKIKAGLVVAGLAAHDTPFVTAALFSTDPIQRTTDNCATHLGLDPYSHVVMGTDQDNALKFFSPKLVEAIARHVTKPGDGVINKLVAAVREAARETIDRVAASTTDVGGTLRYACIRKGFEYKDGYLKGNGSWT